MYTQGADQVSSSFKNILYNDFRFITKWTEQVSTTQLQTFTSHIKNTARMPKIIIALTYFKYERITNVIKT